MDTNGFMLPISFRRTVAQTQRETGSPTEPACAVPCKISDIFDNNLGGLGAGFEMPVVHVQFIFEYAISDSER